MSFDYEFFKPILEADLLMMEIKEILPLVSNLTTHDGTAIISFESELTEEQLNSLTTLVAAHDPSNLTSKQYKIHAYFDSRKYNKLSPPVDVDFITGLNIKLHRKSILVKGECQAEEYYTDYDGTTYSNMIVKESHVFTRDAIGFALRRDTTLQWVKNNESLGPVLKTLTKYYSPLERILEGKTRRGNLVDNLQLPVISLISFALTGNPNPTLPIIVHGREFLATYKSEFDNFVGASDKTILSCLNDSNHAKYISSANWSWIDSMTPYGVTIRQYLISELTI